jgi:short-subunit dehydrogenase
MSVAHSIDTAARSRLLRRPADHSRHQVGSAWALRNELKDTNITVTCLMPGATETEFFKRADMMDTKVGTESKMDAAEVARIGFKAMMDGEGDVVAGLKNKLQAAVASVTPSAVLAERHRKMAEPGTAKQ